MGWSISDLGIASFTVLGVFPALLIIGLVFFIGGLGLYIAGLVSAMIYLLAGVGVLWILSLFGLFKRSWGYLFLLILPIAALWGWGVDHISFLSSMPSPANWLAAQPMVTLPMNDLNGFPVSFALSFESLGVIISTVGMVVGVSSLVLTLRSKRKR